MKLENEEEISYHVATLSKLREEKKKE